MSLTVIAEQIRKFVRSSTPEVMAIKGAWGVGKTYGWKKYLQEECSQGTIGFERYSYVSLFGINSLDSLKFSIFENVVTKKLIGTEPNIETFKSNAKAFGESFGRSSLRFFQETPIAKWFNPAIQSLSFLSLQNTLICIDDFERKGNGLTIKDILGLISHLKEQKKCKIVILLNDGEDGLDEYTKYKEKVVDIELAFSPSAAESASIAFSDQKINSKRLAELTTKLDIRNIRVLKKIESFVDATSSFVSGYESEIHDQLLHSLTLFTWSYYCSGTGGLVPTLDFVTNMGYTFFGLGKDKDDEDDKIKSWKAILRDYDFHLTDDFDLVIADSIKRGYFIESELKLKANEKNTAIVASKGSDSFHDVWKLYHNSFDDNANDVVASLYESFKVNVKHISSTNLNGTVTLFRSLAKDEFASELIDIFISEHMDEPRVFNVKDMRMFGDVLDAEIIEKFNVVYQSSIPIETVLQVLERIVVNDNWNSNDEVVLAGASVDDFYNLFKSIKGNDLSYYINACLKFGSFANSSELQLDIASRAKQALQTIGAESAINKLRVRKYGINI